MQTDLFIERLLSATVLAGFEAAECYLSTGDSFDATAHEGEVNAYNVSSEIGLGFRALVGGKVGYASTQVLDEAAIDQLIEGARTNAALIENDDQQFIFAGSDAYPALNAFNPALEAVSAARKLETLLALEKAARTLDPRVGQIDSCGLFTSRSGVRIVNSRGLDVSFEDNGASLYVSPVAREGDAICAPFRFRYGRDFEALDVAALAREAVDAAIAGLYAAPVPSGDYAVVLGPEAATDLLQVFAPVFSADAAQKGLSLLKGREGEAIASASVSIWDDPLRADTFGGAPFDGEGVAARAKPVLEAGVLTTLLHNLKTAAAAGTQTTGNAARGSYGGPVTVAPTNFFVAPGEHAPEALYRMAGGGLLITQVEGLHAGANAVSGAFSLSARGFVIEGGTVGRAVKGITVAGNFFDLLKQIQAVGADLWFGLPGVSCYGSPSLFAGTLKIAGV